MGNLLFSAKLLGVTETSGSKQPSLIAQLAVLTLGRLLVNTALRMTYPFLPAFARGLNVSITAVAGLVSLRNFAGLVSPLFGPLSERFGRRPVLSLGLFLLGAGCLIVVIWPGYWFLGLSLGAIGLGKVIYDPAMHAYLGDVVPYRQRGRAIALTELSWAGSFFLGMPAIGLIIQYQGWQAPFLWLGIGALAVAVLIWRALPRDDGWQGRIAGWRAMFGIIRRQPVVWIVFGYILLIMMANEIILIVYGAWMEDSFGLSLASLGLAAGVIGGAEIMGELFAGWSVDRFGKRPVILVTGVLTVLMYLILPFTGITSLTGALISLFFLFLFFEITVVGGIPLLTEVMPTARSVLLSMALAGGSLGRAIGALAGPALWQAGGLSYTSLATGAVMATAIFLLFRWIREAEETGN